MNVVLSRQAEEDFLALPSQIRKKVIKKLAFLEKDLRYPSLRAKKLVGESDR